MKTTEHGFSLKSSLKKIMISYHGFDILLIPNIALYKCFFLSSKEEEKSNF